MAMHPPILAFLSNLGMPELIVIGIVALIVFGKRLPEVGRSLGRGIVEFKKGLRETGDEINQIGDTSKDIPSRSTPVSQNQDVPAEQRRNPL